MPCSSGTSCVARMANKPDPPDSSFSSSFSRRLRMGNKPSRSGIRGWTAGSKDDLRTSIQADIRSTSESTYFYPLKSLCSRFVHRMPFRMTFRLVRTRFLLPRFYFCVHWFIAISVWMGILKPLIPETIRN
jgi:hypothetical protein